MNTAVVHCGTSSVAWHIRCQRRTARVDIRKFEQQLEGATLRIVVEINPLVERYTLDGNSRAASPTMIDEATRSEVHDALVTESEPAIVVQASEGVDHTAMTSFHPVPSQTVQRKTIS